MDRAAVDGRTAPAAISLADWIAGHGPLWPAEALVIVLETCAAAARLRHGELTAVVGSLDVSRIRRTVSGWSWAPVVSASALQTVGDAEVVERLGAILFFSLTGQAVEYPFPEEQALRAQLRGLRPDLSPPVTDVTVRSLAARRHAGVTLFAFAGDLRRALGVERGLESSRKRRASRVAGASVALAAVAFAAWWSARPEGRLERHGLTREETVLLDVAAESADTTALIDEHTASIQHYLYIARLWQARVPPEDPRIAWNHAHEAWVRTLAGDRLTAEQLLEHAPDWLARELGDRHPYTRAVRLGLAATLDARGADGGAVLRLQAEKAALDLLAATGGVPFATSDVPAPPGTVAHVAPNPPEREGFRADGEGGYFIPLTSLQRWIAARAGWRLHFVADGPCRASFVTGTDPGRIELGASRSPDGAWQLRIEGTSPAVTVQGPARASAGVSLSASPAGAVEARISDKNVYPTTIDRTGPPPDPPYRLAFRGEGCSLVWLEIPFTRTAL
jgi:hypothetical protein